jgi:hypothetical protein
VERRDLVRALGAAAAFTLMPRTAQAAWKRVAAQPNAPPRVLRAGQPALVAAIADAIIPRIDTPGATDVGVPAFIDLVVADFYDDDERAAFLAGLDAIEARARAAGAASFVEMAPGARTALMDALDRPLDRQAPEARGWSRLKGLVIHGYFTSERVQKDVLKTVVMPMRFDGNVPMKAASGGADA